MSLLDRANQVLGIKPPILIAEIGNNHFGSLNLAKTLIRLAKDSGADLVKLQCGVKAGSMPPDFYEECRFSVSECLGLIEFGNLIGTTVFFSVFDDEYEPVLGLQQFNKIAASQSPYMESAKYDNDRTFISFKQREGFHPENLQSCAPMLAGEYLDHRVLRELPKGFGWSDHSKGIYNCIRAVQEFNAPVIEKHFTLEHKMSFNNQVFRDTIHGATPEEFSLMSRIIKGRL